MGKKSKGLGAGKAKRDVGGSVKEIRAKFKAARARWREDKENKALRKEKRRLKKQLEAAKESQAQGKGKEGKRGASKGKEDSSIFFLDRKGDDTAKKINSMEGEQEQEKASATNKASFEVDAPEYAKPKDNKIIKEVPNDTVRYFREVIETLQTQEFNNDEDREILISNVVEEMKGYETSLAANKGTSAGVQAVLQQASDIQVLDYLKAIMGNFNVLAKDRCASHVMQTALSRIPLMIAGTRKLKGAGTADMTKEISDVFCSLCKELLDDFNNLFFDRYASHVVRTILKILIGFRDVAPGSDAESRRRKNNKFKFGSTRPSRSHLTDDMNNLLEMMLLASTQADDSTLEAACFHANAGPVIQHLLDCLPCLGDQELCEKFVARLLFWKEEKATSTEYLDSLVKDRRGSHLVEKIISVATDRTFSNLYVKGFRGKLADLGSHSIANFTVQRLLENLRDRAQAQLCFDELKHHLKALLDGNRTGILWKLAECCGKFSTRQREFVKGLKNILVSGNGKDGGALADEAKKNQAFVRNLLLLGTYGVGGDGDKIQKGGRSSFNVMGTAILQCILRKFEERFAVQVVRGLNLQEAAFLLQLACDRSGSRVLDSAFASKGIPNKVKQKLIDKFKGHFVELGTNTFGSFCAERCYAAASIDRKRSIAQELLDSERTLSGSRSGQILLSKCRVDKFKRKQLEWEEELSAEQKKLDMFSDFLGDIDRPHTKKAETKETSKNFQAQKTNEERAKRLGGKEVDETMEKIFGTGLKKKEVSEKVSKSKGAGGDSKQRQRAVEIEKIFREDSGGKRKKKQKRKAKDSSKGAKDQNKINSDADRKKKRKVK